MSDSRKYLLGATATIVAARIAARAQERTGGDLQKPPGAPALKDEFVATYRELEQALAEIGATGAQAPYGEKAKRDNKRDNEHLIGD
jgi:hypothetical protein